MIAGDAHDRPLGRQIRELGVELLDRALLLLRVLGVPGLVYALVVDVHEGVARIQPL